MPREVPHRRSSRRRSCLHIRRMKTRDYLILLIIGFLTAFASFTLTLYINSSYFFEVFGYLLSFKSHKALSLPLRSHVGENYRPRDFSGKSQSLNYDYYIKYNDFDYLRPESLTYKSRIYSNNTEILFRFPKKTSISNLLLIFHACKHSAHDWFYTPERQRIIGAAIDLGYGCLVFQATDKDNQCWSNDADIYENKDVQMIFKGLEGFYEDYPKLISLPRFTFGSSSGGIFSSIFAINQKYEIHGQILFNSIILPEILYTYVKAKTYPPTAWIHMLRDIEFASEERINISKQIFIEHEIPCNAFPVEPISLLPGTFSNRIPSVSSETSRFLLYRLQQNRWINSYNYLIYNPRRKLDWQTFLFPSSPPTKSEEMFNNLNKNKNITSEFLNTIYGEHEISYERSYEALNWIKRIYIEFKKKSDSKM